MKRKSGFDRVVVECFGYGLIISRLLRAVESLKAERPLAKRLRADTFDIRLLAHIS